MVWYRMVSYRVFGKDIALTGDTDIFHGCYEVPSFSCTFTAIHYLNYPDLLPYWPRSSIGRASAGLIPEVVGSNPIEVKYSLPGGVFKRVVTQGICCIGSIFTTLPDNYMLRIVEETELQNV